MGIINCTPDSFFEGSRRVDPAQALERALAMESQGASILDVGGESSRPGSGYVDQETELARVVPVVKAIRAASGVCVSVDTRKAAVALAALEAGADIVNDISALEDDPGMAGVIRSSGAAVILMHKRGEPKTMQEAPEYQDVVAEVREYLGARARFALSSGIGADRIVLDPGFGFGKRYEDNLDLLIHLAELSPEGYPLLVGASRKAFLGMATGRGVHERMPASIAVHAIAMRSGAAIVRAHDVAETVDAARLAKALADRS
jgi:dihydropteroate synthase